MFEYYKNEFHMAILLNKIANTKTSIQSFKRYLAGNASTEETQQITNLLASLKSEYPDADIQAVLNGWKKVENISSMNAMNNSMKNYF